jgi:hypothetical protein
MHSPSGTLDPMNGCRGQHWHRHGRSPTLLPAGVSVVWESWPSLTLSIWYRRLDLMPIAVRARLYHFWQVLARGTVRLMVNTARTLLHSFLHPGTGLNLLRNLGNFLKGVLHACRGAAQRSRCCHVLCALSGMLCIQVYTLVSAD